jgi:uncharacterized DUF497 family protein
LEWHYAKARSNYAKHGVRFDTAKRAVTDPFAVEALDHSGDYGEEVPADRDSFSATFTPHGKDVTA